VSDNVYLPEVHGFEAFGSASTGGGYDWGEFGVWLKDGVFYWASDSGCSCNGPWEDFWGGELVLDFDGQGSAHDTIRALNKWSGSQYAADGSEALLTRLLDYRAPREAA
jgi:hypothetical protein